MEQTQKEDLPEQKAGEENDGASVLKETETTQTGEGEGKGSPKKKRAAEYFSAKKISTLGIMCALSFVVSLFEFPIFPSAAFLELDFGNVFIMLTAFLYGPVEGVIVCVIKELLHIPVGSTGGVGELANIIMTTTNLLLPATLYRFRKGLKVVIPSLIAATVLMAAISLPVNRFINFPFFAGEAAVYMFHNVWYLVLCFNLIKGAAISALTCVLYKSLSRVLKR